MILEMSAVTRKKIFLEYLNLIYSNKSYLREVYLEMKNLATNKTLILAIEETRTDNICQIEHIGAMFKAIDEPFTEKRLLSYKILTLEAYKVAVNKSLLTLERDCAIIFYMQVVESVEVLYFKTLMDMARGLHYKFMNIKLPYDTALENQKLLYDIHAEMVA
jgi:ferritin-like metal-binding protein YciE